MRALFFLFEAVCAFIVFSATGWTLAFLLGAGLLVAFAIECYQRARRIAVVYACIKILSDRIASIPVVIHSRKSS